MMFADNYQINELEIQLRAKESTEAELRQSNKRLQAKCNDYERSIDKIVPKYQEALNERGQAAHDIQESMARETSMRQKLDARTSELSKVREQKALVDAELAEARIALSSSSIPEVAELQKVKDELRAAQFDLEKAQKKLASAQNDVDYMRSNYQEASSAAAEMRSELDELKAKNVVLARKADDNAVEIHRIQASNDIKEYLQLISELEVEKAGVERELEKKAEELRTLLNGRRTTRGTSVPRSPRMGTMSPGQSSRPMSRVLGGVGSRGSSPAPGGSESGFRGPGTFGDALYPGVANRFHHLS
jgi:chromosome segregation ATPase